MHALQRSNLYFLEKEMQFNQRLLQISSEALSSFSSLSQSGTVESKLNFALS